MNRNDDDNIPDPNSFVFMDDGSISPKLIVQFMANVSKAVSGTQLSLEVMTKQFQKMEQAVETLVTFMQDQRVEKEKIDNEMRRIDGRIDDRKEQIKQISAAITRAHERIDTIESHNNAKAAESIKAANDHTDKAIASVYRTSAAVWVVSAFLITIIFTMSAQNIADIKRSIEIIGETRK